MTERDIHFREMLIDACGIALAEAARPLHPEQRAQLVSFAQQRLHQKLAGGRNIAIVTGLSRAVVQAVDFTLSAFDAALSTDETPASLHDLAVCRRLRVLCAELLQSDRLAMQTLEAIMLAVGDAQRDAMRPGGCASVGPQSATAEKSLQSARNLPIMLTTLLTAPHPLPHALLAYLSGNPATARQPPWLEALTVYVVWEIKQRANLRYAILPEIDAPEQATRRQAEQLLENLYQESRATAERLHHRLGATVPPAPAPAAPAEDEPSLERHLGACALALCHVDGVPAPALEPAVKTIAPAASPAGLKTIELLAALEQLHVLIDADGKASSVAGLPANVRVEASRLVRQGALDACFECLSGWHPVDIESKVGRDRMLHALSMAVGNYRRATEALMNGLQAVPIGERADGYRDAADLAWALLLWSEAPADRTRLRQSAELAGIAMAVAQQAGDAAHDQKAAMIRGLALAAEDAAAPDPGRQQEIIELIEPCLTPGHPPREAIRLKASLALARALMNAAPRDSQNTAALLARSAEAFRSVTASTLAALDPLLLADAAVPLCDVMVRLSIRNPREPWGLEAAVTAAAAYRLLERAPQTGIATDVIEALARAQAHVGQAAKSQFWLHSAIATMESLLPRVDAIKQGDLQALLGNVLTRLAAGPEPDPVSLERAIGYYRQAADGFTPKRPYRWVQATIGLATALLHIGRMRAEPASLEAAVETACHVVDTLTGEPFRPNRMQAHLIVAEALIERATLAQDAADNPTGAIADALDAAEELAETLQRPQVLQQIRQLRRRAEATPDSAAT